MLNGLAIYIFNGKLTLSFYFQIFDQFYVHLFSPFLFYFIYLFIHLLFFLLLLFLHFPIFISCPPSLKLAFALALLLDGKEDNKKSALWNNDSEKFVIQQWHALSVQYKNKIFLPRDKEKNNVVREIE